MRDRLPVVLSTTALLVALFGATPLGEAAYNAVVPKNSVGAAQLRKGSVTNAKLRGDAVTSGKVKNRSLKAVDFALGQLPAGPAGPQGEKGDAGSNGAPGVSGYEFVRVTKTHDAPFLFPPDAVANCPAGKVVTGGTSLVQYYNAVGFLRLGDVESSQTSGDRPNHWTTYASSPPAGVTRVVVHANAICIAAT